MSLLSQCGFDDTYRHVGSGAWRLQKRSRAKRSKVERGRKKEKGERRRQLPRSVLGSDAVKSRNDEMRPTPAAERREAGVGQRAATRRKKGAEGGERGRGREREREINRYSRDSSPYHVPVEEAKAGGPRSKKTRLLLMQQRVLCKCESEAQWRRGKSRSR